MDNNRSINNILSNDQKMVVEDYYLGDCGETPFDNSISEHSSTKNIADETDLIEIKDSSDQTEGNMLWEEKYDKVEDTDEYRAIELELMHKVYSEIVKFKLNGGLFIAIENDSDPYDPYTPEQRFKASELLESDPSAALDILGYEMGDCHMIWYTKKEILKRDYNIDWKSPAELNPDILYD